MERAALTLTLVTAVGATLLSAPAQAAGAPAGFKPFVSKAFHYQIAYPSGWRVKAGNGKTHDFFLGTTVGRFTTNVNIYAIDGAGSMSLGDLTKLLVSVDRKAGAAGIVSGKGRVGTYDAALVRGRLTQSHVTESFTTAAFIASGKLWEVTLSSNPSAVKSVTPTFATMLKTFALNG